MNTFDAIEAGRLRKDIPPFRPGDQVKVHVKVTEGQRERIQVFEGVVLGRRGGGIRESFTVRKISFGVGVERTFPLHTPSIEKIEIVRHGKVRRAKLYYLRDRVGRKAKIDERRTRIQEWSADAPPVAEEPPAEEVPVDEAPAEALDAAVEPEAVVDEAPVAEAPAETPAAETSEAPEPASEPVVAQDAPEATPADEEAPKNEG